jgi:hypothetical protein
VTSQLEVVDDVVLAEQVAAGAGEVARRRPACSAACFAGRLALLGFGTFMSLWRIDVPSWNGDELVYAGAGNNYWQGDYAYNPEHPPLGKLLIGLSEHLGGQTLWAARLPAGIAMLLGGLLLWGWLSRAVSPAAGWTAAALWWALPGLTSFPELLGDGPYLDLPQRWALLGPLAAVLALAALLAGWWWMRSGRLAWALTCGLLAGAAVATKLPAVLIVAVPAVAGPLATLARCPPAWAAQFPGWPPGTAAVFGWLARLPRAAGHAATWLAGAALAFAMAYAPMGAKQAVDSIEAGWRFQRGHGASGHSILLRGQVYAHAPWWSLAWWQYAALGTAVTAVALLATVAGLALRSGLTAYLTAAWLLPMITLVPVAHLALPHYELIWRAPLIGGAVAGASVALRRLSRLRRPRGGAYDLPVTAAVLLLALLPPAVLAGRTAAHTATLRPSGYGALPALAGPGEVQVVGNVTVVRRYLPEHRVQGVRNAPRPHRQAPGTIVLDRASTSRFSDYGLVAWARLHKYRHTRTGTLEVYVRPR